MVMDRYVICVSVDSTELTILYTSGSMIYHLLQWLLLPAITVSSGTLLLAVTVCAAIAWYIQLCYLQYICLCYNSAACWH
jgi:hypothetical protein